MTTPGPAWFLASIPVRVKIPVPMTMPTPKPIRSSGPRRRLSGRCRRSGRRARRPRHLPGRGRPPPAWSAVSSVRSWGRRYRRGAVPTSRERGPCATAAGVKGWAHDTALRVVRRPERRQPAALLGRRGVDQPRRARGSHPRWTSPASGRPHEVASPAPYGSQGQQGGAAAGRASRTGRVSSRPSPRRGRACSSAARSRPPPTVSVLSGWWRRVAARIVDGVICAVITVAGDLPGAEPRRRDHVRLLPRQHRRGRRPGARRRPPPSGLGLGAAAGQPGQHASSTSSTRSCCSPCIGTTPGRRLVGISVRLRERPGPPPLSAVLRRTVVKEGGSIVGLLPVVGLLGSLFTILDSLWPLWDDAPAGPARQGRAPPTSSSASSTRTWAPTR